MPSLNAERPGQDVLYHRRYGYSLHPLAAPRRVYLPRVAAPEVFGVVLEEKGVERPAEAVDVEVLEVGLGLLRHECPKVAPRDGKRLLRPEVSERLGLQGDGIVIEPVLEEYA